MRNAILSIGLLAALAAGASTAVAAGGATVERIRDFDTVLAVAMPADFPTASFMRAHCSRLVRVERPDGSASEAQNCRLSDEPVPDPFLQGVPPTRAFVFDGESCVWFSDYWGNTEGLAVGATSVHYTVTPSGQVHVRSEYPAQPLVCDEAADAATP